MLPLRNYFVVISLNWTVGLFKLNGVIKVINKLFLKVINLSSYYLSWRCCSLMIKMLILKLEVRIQVKGNRTMKLKHYIYLLLADFHLQVCFDVNIDV